ncbi:MAG: efflux RND transporter periplasmic adaptor subunit [Candidatus Thiodiazotropha lotti]|nr:efflux RND transporter periplasmic adaptor subunit [Candidatus Thiodiazotropha lotti]MCW4221454.1 efflux RND transporter periplasmic adaptor subunit [Candidatus Thiodiazotropha lotti]
MKSLTISGLLVMCLSYAANQPQGAWFLSSARADEQPAIDDQHSDAEHQHEIEDHDHQHHASEPDHPHDHAEQNHDHTSQHSFEESDHGQGGEDDHSEHNHPDEEAIQLTPEVIKEFGIEVGVATRGSISRTLHLSGEVIYNADRIAHVSPMVAGRVQQVNVSVSDQVEAGQVMAVLTSRELAATRSDYLAAVARLELARENHLRNKRLLSEKVGTKRDADESRQLYREAVIARNQAVNSLYALGFTKQQVAEIAELDVTSFSAYQLTAPLSGIVTERHITIGEVIGQDGADVPFVVADLSSVWINLTVYQRDLPLVRRGLPVTIRFGEQIPDAQGQLAFISPALDETTRTATARVVVEQLHEAWRPGLFVSGEIEVSGDETALLVPATALTEMDGKHLMFILTEAGFEPREVKTGRSTPQVVEIIDGLAEDEHFALNNVLALKTEIDRAALEHAGHTH